MHYDLSGSDPAIASFLNAGAGTAFSGAIASAKTFLPEIPLNSGFYRAVTVDVGEEGTVVNAGWPVAVTGSVSGAYEKIMNAGFELWSQVMPERAMACCFNLEYLLVGGRDARREDRPFFMWYDWMAGGWGGRQGRDGQDCTSPVFGVGLAVQPLEGQERLTPVLTSGHEIIPDSGGPGTYRGGVGVRKGGTLTQVEGAVMSYCCDRARSVTWGIGGGLPSIPHGVWLHPGTDRARFLGANFSGVPVAEGDVFERPSAGGGGLGDPLERDPQAVLEDVEDGYVTVRRAAIDYGVVVEEVDGDLAEYRLDDDATAKRRADQRQTRVGKLDEDPEDVTKRFCVGELDTLDLVRHYGVVLDWGTGELLPRTTANTASSSGVARRSTGGAEHPSYSAGMTSISATSAGTFTIGGDLEVTRLGYGAMRIVGDGVWGPANNHDQVIEVLRRLPELGVDFIDTADSYGPDYSEEYIAEALAPYEGRMAVATKGGFTRHGPGIWREVGRREYLRQCALMSLRRLKVDTIDLYQLHRIDPRTDRDEQFGELKALQSDGLVRHLGLSEVSVEEIKAAQEVLRGHHRPEPLQPHRSRVRGRAAVLRGAGDRLHPVGPTRRRQPGQAGRRG